MTPPALPVRQTSGSDSEATYSSGASATSGQQEPSVTWDPLHAASAVTDRTGCIIWEGAELKKVDLTTLDICSVIVNRVEAMPQSTDYLIFGELTAQLWFILTERGCVFRVFGSLSPVMYFASAVCRSCFGCPLRGCLVQPRYRFTSCAHVGICSPL